MTTFDLHSALRHALTTLVGSQPSSGGLQPSQTDKGLEPEERLAARMVRRFHLRPAVDVEGLARQLADLTEKTFPVPVDGLCLDLKVPGKRPKIWISRNITPVRRRFTLAHEIGHIVIPWHTGSIVDDLEAPLRATGRYKVMEAEANRFAAELLMPTDWVKDLAERSEHIAGLVTTIQRVAEVSWEAAVIRALKYGKPGYIYAKVENGVVIQTRRTRGTWSNPPEVGTLVHLIDLPTASERRIITHGESDHFWWRVDSNVLPAARPRESWRDILDSILLSVPLECRENSRARVNAIVGNAMGRNPRGSPVDVVYGRVLAATKNRVGDNALVSAVMNHPDFNRYLLARCYDWSDS